MAIKLKSVIEKLEELNPEMDLQVVQILGTNKNNHSISILYNEAIDG